MVRIDGKLVEEEYPDETEISGYGDSLCSSSDTCSLDSYAQEVVQKMSEDNIPPLPSNYRAYFEKLLDEKDAETRQQIIELMNIEDTSNEDKILTLEHSVKENFTYIKQILNIISTIYKNSTVMQELLLKKDKELQASSNALHIKNVVGGLKSDVKALSENTKKPKRKAKRALSKVYRYY
jgi:hypothetical protein